MPKLDRVKYRTKKFKKKKSFPAKRDVNTEVISDVNNVYNESINEENELTVNTELNPIDINVVDTVFVDNNKSTVNVNVSNTSISSAKLQEINASTPNQSHPLISGYRIVDTVELFDVFKMLSCPECHGNTLVLSDNLNKRQGLASFLELKCSICSFSTDFCTSRKAGKGFDINKRVVYTMRTLGRQGHADMQKFTSLMDIPPPMTQNNYDKLVTSITEAVKTVAEETMADAAAELRNNVDVVVDTGISCDGSWQRRGFASNNGVVTVISIDNGKILDVEPMSRICKACNLKESMRKDNPESYADWRNSHQCKYNYQGSAGGMETVGAKRIFERSIEK